MKKILFPLLFAALISCSGGNQGSQSGQSDSSASAYGAKDNNQDEDEESEEYEGPESESEDAEIVPDICTSDDGIVTIETAMYPDCGTMREYWSRWKFKNKEGKNCEAFLEQTPYVSKVYTIKKDDGSTYYVTNGYGQASSMDGYKWLEAYKIVGDTIERVQLIDGSKIPESDSEDSVEDFSIEFCTFNYYLIDDGDNDKWVYEYDPKTRDFYIPLMVGPTLVETYPSDRYILWHFNGERFENMGEKPNKNLNPSLADYNRLLKYFETEDFIVRVDSLNSNSLRYASWKKPKTVKDTPDIVIKGGSRQTHDRYDGSSETYDDYRFKNGQYEYIVNLREIEKDQNNWAESNYYLVITKDGEIVLKQKQKSMD